jgi:endo-1,4-beta-xylanase
MSLASFVLLAVLASPILAAPAPTVSLLIDQKGYASSGAINLKSTLQKVASRKGGAFHFGSTYDTSYPASEASFTQNVYTTFFNHMVAENGCKWQSTEPSPGTSSLTACKGVQSFAAAHGDTFRGHNTFWHEQLPVRPAPRFNCSGDIDVHALLPPVVAPGQCLGQRPR